MNDFIIIIILKTNQNSTKFINNFEETFEKEPLSRCNMTYMRT